MHEFRLTIDKIYNHLKLSADPDRAFLYFCDFLANSTAKSTIFELLISFKVVGEILFGIFTQSETLSNFLVNNAEYFFWLIEADTLGKSKTSKDHLNEINELLRNADRIGKKEYLLRHYRKRGYLRIATREIVNACPFEEILLELSELADALIEAALEIAYLKLKKNPSREGFCVIGLGKLGNRELNFSSDIDLIFVHRDDKNSEFYNRLAGQLVKILSENKEGGFVYRVDTRLRPGGNAYPLSLSIDEYENYYYTFGQPWERLSLVKARCVAGDKRLGEEFLKMIEPFVYPKSIDIEYVKEIRSLMFKIHKNFTTKECVLPRDIQDIKKGKGGIREIEFIVNYFQLLFGGKNKNLRHVSTVEGLKILGELGLLRESKRLEDIYLFFRRIEHKIQLKQEQQTQLLPCDEDELDFLARILGYDLDSFVERYKNDAAFVHSVFREIFVESSSFPVLGSFDDIEGFLKEFGIGNASSLAKLVLEVVKKYKASGVKIEDMELIFDRSFELTKDVGLFDRVVEGLNRIDPVYVASICKSPRLLDLFVKLLAIGYGEKLFKQPVLMDTLLSPGKLEIEELSLKEKERLEFEIVLKLLGGNFDHEDFRVTTEFARRFIKSMCGKYDLSHGLAIVGYGKLATDELFIGSDLDLVFVCESDPYNFERIVVKIVKELKKVYEVDLRLRPYGDKGSIVVDLDYLKRYFKKEAASWEKQAAQKSKVIYSGFGTNSIERIYKDFVLNNPPSKSDIWEIFKKIESNKAKGLDLKSSFGCLTNIEFIAQAVCFENGCIEYSKGAMYLLDKLEKLGFSYAELLKEVYLYFFKLLNVLRVAKMGSRVDEKALKLLEFILAEEGVKQRIESYRNRVMEVNREVFG